MGGWQPSAAQCFGRAEVFRVDREDQHCETVFLEKLGDITHIRLGHTICIRVLSSDLIHVLQKADGRPKAKNVFLALMKRVTSCALGGIPWEPLSVSAACY